MKNPVEYFRETINNVKVIKSNISSKQQEIDNCKKQLDEIKFEKDSTSFKWYDVKNKAHFNDEIKTEKKLLKAKITKLENEINDLEKQIGIETNKRNKLLLCIGIGTFIMICVIAITIGSINEKIHPEPKTAIEDFETASITETDISTTEPLSETTTEFIIISTSEVTTNETTEKTTKEVNEKITESTTSRSQKIVYGSRTGNHYHTKDCRYANGTKMTVAEAERKGWEPCAVCNP